MSTLRLRAETQEKGLRNQQVPNSHGIGLFQLLHLCAHTLQIDILSNTTW